MGETIASGEKLSFNDFIKKKALESFEKVPLQDVLISLAVVLVIGLAIFFVYKYTFGGVMYSKSFNLSLVCLAILTNFIIITISSNLGLSLGMVGALSIVRFRTAIKDPLDLVFLFWAIGAGIITGAQFYIVAIAGSLLMAAILIVFNIKRVVVTPYLLVVNAEDVKLEEQILGIVKSNFKAYRLKSKIMSGSNVVEWIYEIRGKNTNTGFMEEISKLNGVTNTSMVSYNGEYAG